MSPATRSGPLPLAPRPLPGEAVTSWIGRIAARYDLPPDALIAGLRDGAGIPASRLVSLDRCPDTELECLLATAAHIELRRIGGLRAVAPEMPAWLASFRLTPAWCLVCVCEDAALWGENYERGIWRLSCCAMCAMHGQVLVQICPVCARGRGGYRPSGGRWRLLCESCGSRIDAAPNHRLGVAPGISGTRLFGWTVDPRWILLACELQSDLLAAIAGTSLPNGGRDSVADRRLASLVHDMATAFLRPLAPPSNSVREDTFAVLQPTAALEMLGVIASVLVSAGNGLSPRSPDRRRTALTTDRTVMDLSWFVGMLPPGRRKWLCVAAEHWGPGVTRTMERAVRTEAAGRHRTERIHDKARRDATWLREAVPRLQAAAIRRLAERAYRQARDSHDRKEQRAKQIHAPDWPADSCHQ